MKKITILLAFLLVACGRSNESQPQTAAQEAPVVDHQYSLKDGYEYGYEQAISQAAQEQGQAAQSLAMFKYSGERNGVYQAYNKQGSVVTAVECTKPCEFMKIMVFASGVGHVRTERLRNTPGTIGWSVISDAQNGKLEQFVGEKDGRKYNVWWEEKKPKAEIVWLDSGT